MPHGGDLHAEVRRVLGPHPERTIPSLAWAPQGDAFAYEASYGLIYGSPTYLSIYDLRSGGNHPLTPDWVESADHGTVRLGGWSPDGRWLSFVASSETRLEIGIAGRQGHVRATSRRERFTAGFPRHDEGWELGLGPWSPVAQRWLVVAAPRRPEGADATARLGRVLHWVDTGARITRTLRLPVGQVLGDPHWSPDGQVLAYEPKAGGGDVCLLDMASGDSRRVATGYLLGWLDHRRLVTSQETGEGEERRRSFAVVDRTTKEERRIRLGPDEWVLGPRAPRGPFSGLVIGREPRADGDPCTVYWVDLLSRDRSLIGTVPIPDVGAAKEPADGRSATERFVLPWSPRRPVSQGDASPDGRFVCWVAYAGEGRDMAPRRLHVLDRETRRRGEWDFDFVGGVWWSPVKHRLLVGAGEGLFLLDFGDSVAEE